MSGWPCPVPAAERWGWTARQEPSPCRILDGPRLSAQVGLLGSAFPFSLCKTKTLLNQLPGVESASAPMASGRLVLRHHPPAPERSPGTTDGRSAADHQAITGGLLR